MKNLNVRRFQVQLHIGDVKGALPQNLLADVRLAKRCERGGSFGRLVRSETSPEPRPEEKKTRRRA